MQLTGIGKDTAVDSWSMSLFGQLVLLRSPLMPDTWGRQECCTCWAVGAGGPSSLAWANRSWAEGLAQGQTGPFLSLPTSLTQGSDLTPSLMGCSQDGSFLLLLGPGHPAEDLGKTSS